MLRGIEHFVAAGAPVDERLSDAIDEVRRIERRDGTWPTFSPYPGRYWFRIETRGASRWSTLRALRVLAWWDEIAREQPSPAIDRRVGEGALRAGPVQARST